MKYLSYFFASVLLAQIILFACHHQPDAPKPNPDPDPDNVNPCKNLKALSADFQILEPVGDSLVETDMVLFYKSITFQANITGREVSYEWQIGDDSRVFTDRKVTLFFTDDMGNINVSLKVKGTPNLSCFPNEQASYTKSKTFTIVPRKKAPILGKYQGYFASNPSDKNQVVEIKYYAEANDPDQDPYNPMGCYQITNISKGCSLPNIGYPCVKGGDAGGNSFVWKATDFFAGNCLGVYAFLKLTKPDSLQAEFSYQTVDNVNSPRYNDKFFGKRIP